MQKTVQGDIESNVHTHMSNMRGAQNAIGPGTKLASMGWKGHCERWRERRCLPLSHPCCSGDRSIAQLYSTVPLKIARSDVTQEIKWILKAGSKYALGSASAARETLETCDKRVTIRQIILPVQLQFFMQINSKLWHLDS
eukprot:3336548-Amphidinium_carterae.1